VILPELNESLGRYAQTELASRKVEIRTDTRVTAFSERGVELSNGETLPTQTLVWTAGVTPPAVLQNLPVKKEKGRIVVNETLDVPDVPGVWAVGDCAWISNSNTGKPHPPTAQHAYVKRCIARRTSLLQYATHRKTFLLFDSRPARTIGHRAGVAEIFGLRLSGFVAWWLWRTIYLAKLPTLEKKLRVALRWTLDFAFPRDLTQHVTLHGIDRVTQLLADVRKHPIPRPQKATSPSSALSSSP
jgi:NADH dehydrogenase